MTNASMLRYLTLTAVLFFASEGFGQLATYQDLPKLPIPRRIRTSPHELQTASTTFSVAFGPQQTMFSVDVNGIVWEWPKDVSKRPTTVARTESEPLKALLSDDARALAVADSDGSVTVMDLVRKTTLLRDTSISQPTVALSFSPDGNSVAAVTSGGKIRVWKMTGPPLMTCETAPGPVQTVTFSPDSAQLAVASYTHEILLFELPKSNHTRVPSPTVLRTKGSRVTALQFAPHTRQLVVATSDGSSMVYDVNHPGRPPTSLGSLAFATWSIAFDKAGRRMATGSWDGTIKVWDAKSWKLQQTVKSHEESISTLQFYGPSGFVYAGLDGRLLRWSEDVPSVSASEWITGRSDSVWVAVSSPDAGKLFVGGRERRFEIWDLKAKSPLMTGQGPPTTRCAAFSDTGAALAVGGDDGRVSVHDPDTGGVRVELGRHPGAVSAVVFADQGRSLVSACDGGFVKLWDVVDAKEKNSWHEHRQQIYCAAISPNAKWLVTGGGNWTTGDPGELIVWEYPSGRVQTKLSGHKLAVWSIVFTPDGQHFASSDSSGAVHVWNLERAERVRTLQHSTWVRPLAMSPDGTTLAVGRGDGSLRLWDTKTWKQEAACDGHTSFVFHLHFASNRRLVSGGNDGTVRFWDAFP